MRDESRNQKEICYFCDGYVAYNSVDFYCSWYVRRS